MNTRFYLAYHCSAPRISGGPFTPIHVGRDLADAPLDDMIGDNTGEHISDRNTAWCELTALYWAWKNDTESDAIGLMHYRRILDVANGTPSTNAEVIVPQFNISQEVQRAEDWLEGNTFDMVVPRLHKMGRSMEANYKSGHAAVDWDTARKVIQTSHPAYLPTFDEVAAQYGIRLGNMFLMKRPIFERYCAWLFDILFQVEAMQADRSNYSPYQSRYLGFLAERLFTVFVAHEQKTVPTLNMREVSILNLKRGLVTPYISLEDRPAPETVNIALSADRAYLPHACAMLQSMIDHADPARPINLFFLHNAIDADDLHLLEQMLRQRPRTTLHPIDTAGLFDGSYRSASRAPSNATYNRFLLFSLLPGLERLLYLDADMIIGTDICKLYDTDIGDAQLGAVTDWIMTRTLSGPTRTIDPNVPDLAVYHRETLGLSDAEIARYFNAGVLLFNFAAMEDPVGLGQSLLERAKNGQFLFRDQDILNVAFKDSLFQLDPRWNVFNSLDVAYDRVPSHLHSIAKFARREPWIVHYADRSYKPWKLRPVPHAGLYWEALIKTPFYGEVVRGESIRFSERLEAVGTFIVLAGRSLAERVPFLKRPLLKLYYVLSRRG